MTREQIWDRRAAWPLALVAICYLAAYSVHVLARPGGVLPAIVWIGTWATWGLFVIDYVFRFKLATNRRHWFLHHLFDLLIVALPFMGPLRLLRVVIAFGALQKAVGDAVRGRILLYTATGAGLLVYVASLAILEEERGKLGATITSFGKALWWSMTTVTTVGYGDLYPITVPGRLIAALLMIGGISLIGIVTGLLASWIVQRVAETDIANQAAMSSNIDQLRQEIRTLADQLSAASGSAAPGGGSGDDSDRRATSRGRRKRSRAAARATR